jgi:hypothetical protein
MNHWIWILAAFVNNVSVSPFPVIAEMTKMLIHISAKMIGTVR